MPQVYPETVQLFYEESEKSSAWLDELVRSYRANTSVVLALATGAATFFGFENSRKGFWFALAILAYAFAAIIAGLIFSPVNWRFNVARNMGSEIMKPGEGLESAKAYFDLASAHQDAIQAKVKRIAGWGIAGRFRILVGLTGLVIVFALINLTQEPEEQSPIRVIIMEE